MQAANCAAEPRSKTLVSYSLKSDEREKLCMTTSRGFMIENRE
jgi:hypothetical protein